MRVRELLALGTLVSGLGACAQPDANLEIREKVSTSAFEAEIERGLTAVREVTSADEGRCAGPPLSQVESSLERLSSVLLPLLRARESAFHAYRLLAAGDPGGARRELETVEGELQAIASAHQERARDELDDPLGLLEEARLALPADPARARAPTEALAARLDDLLAKAELFLD
jgi:hypothetical protein